MSKVFILLQNASAVRSCEETETDTSKDVVKVPTGLNEFKEKFRRFTAFVFGPHRVRLSTFSLTAQKFRQTHIYSHDNI